MVYKFYGLNSVSQEELFNAYQELEPYGSGNSRMTTISLVQDAQKRGFQAGWIQVDYLNSQKSIDDLKTWIDSGVPLIVCQQYTKQLSKLGHFRVVIGIDKDNVYLHDPSGDIGGANLIYSTDKFMDFWQQTGDNVIGGVFVWIKKD